MLIGIKALILIILIMYSVIAWNIVIEVLKIEHISSASTNIIHVYKDIYLYRMYTLEEKLGIIKNYITAMNKYNDYNIKFTRMDYVKLCEPESLSEIKKGTLDLYKKYVKIVKAIRHKELINQR